MFKFVLGLLVIAASASSLAQNAFGRIQVAPAPLVTALPGSLHDTMKAMSKAMKSIEVGDASKNPANAQAADLISDLALHSKSFVPDEVAKMPAGERAGALAGYKAMLDETAATARQMAAAFRKNDNAAAARLYDQLNAEKKRGHGEYK